MKRSTRLVVHIQTRQDPKSKLIRIAFKRTPRLTRGPKRKEGCEKKRACRGENAEKGEGSSLSISSIQTIPAARTNPRSQKNPQPATPYDDFAGRPAVDHYDDEGPTNEVDGRGCCGSEPHFSVRESPTTGFVAPGLRAWTFRASADQDSSMAPVSVSSCPGVISIVTLDYSLLAQQ